MNYFDAAHAVLNEAYVTGDTVETVLNRRYPVGRGGVGIAHAKAKRETWTRMCEWMEPGFVTNPNC
jgi:hypothetical protein